MSGNLPFLLSSFVGRSQEVADVQRLLAGHRLVTLIGAGGAGKTRLSLAVASEVADQFADGIFLVELASLSEPALLGQALVTTVGLREPPDQDWLDSLTEWLRPRQVLLLLDNCEHLLVACAQTAVALLHACPQLTILTTSREALGIMGEIAWPVPPLSLSNVDDSVEQLMTCDAVQLFVERATAAAPAFRLNADNAAALTQLCRKLDGLPLAIELAAARTRLLSVAQILARLDENLSLLTSQDPTRPLRQQTLTATLDWSYHALPEEEAALLRTLSIFSGDFTLTAVEALTPHLLPLPLLSHLLDKSLVVIASREPEVTYRLLAMVRQYTWEKLIMAGEETTVRQWHTAYYKQLVQTAAPHLRSQQRPTWQEKLNAEYDNILSALAWLAEQQAVAEGGQMVWDLRWFWYFRGTLSEALRQANIFLSFPATPEEAASRAALYWCIGASSWVFGNYGLAYEALVRGRQLAETASDQAVLAYTLTLQGLMGELTHQQNDNLALHQQAINIFEQIGDQWGQALALYWLADTLRLRRDYGAAFPIFDRSQRLFRQIGDQWGMALSLQGLGSAAYGQGNYLLANGRLTEALQIRRVSGDRWLTAQTLTTLATVLQAQEALETAVSHFREADALYQDVGDDYGRIYALFRLGKLAQQRDDSSTAHTYFQECLTLAEAFEHPGRIADCQAALAQLTREETAFVSPHPALRVTAFGLGDVHRSDGSLITSSEWGYARVKELFFYLVDSGPQTKAQIGLDFWPDASPARLRRNLHDTLYQLRQVLGDAKWIVYENGRYTFNDTLPCQYDVAEFSQHLQTPTIESLQQAVGFYQADFLLDFDGAWCLLRREQLRQKFLAALMQLGELVVGNGRYTQAADIYRQAISYDTLLEAAHRELMRTLISMGEPAQAARHYQLLVQILEDELGIAPAPETAVLWQQLQQKNSPPHPQL